jgi:cell division protein FtsN
MDLAKVGTYRSMTEASLVKARLEANGIDAMVQADTASGAVPFLEVTGVRVFVRPTDLAEALEVLERALPAHTGSGTPDLPVDD